LALPKKDEPPPGPAEQAMALVRSAQEAFEAGELGRATERLIAAIGVQPDTPLPYFLLAQVRTARGEYIEAVEAIRTGMNRAPDWPTTKFQLTDFYGSKPARLAADWAELTKALEANPDHPTLQFLEAYHLWFLGERDRATALFQKLALKIRDSEVVERFLRATHR
jgi:tetratricopeptide (TPR) repeat protein